MVDDQNPTGYAQVIQECDQSSTPILSYVYGHDLIRQTAGGTTLYFGYDGHGSVRYLFTSNAGVGGESGSDIYNYDNYDAFGMLLSPMPAWTTR